MAQISTAELDVHVSPSGCRTAVRWWDSLADMCAEAARQRWTRNNEYDSAEIRTIRADLEAGRCPQTVREQAARLMGELELAMAATDLTGASAKRRRLFADDGDEIDVDRMLAEHPTPWRTTRRGKPARLVRLGVNCLMSYGNGADNYATLAATACAVADTLQRIGYAVEVVGMLAGEPCRNNMGDGRRIDQYAACVYLKRAVDPLDLDLVGTIGSMHFHHWMNRGARLLDVPCAHSSNSWGACVNADALRAAVGIDYLFTRSWFGGQQKSLYEGIQSVLGAAVENTAA